MRRKILYTLLITVLTGSVFSCKKLVSLDLPPKPVVNTEEDWVMLGRNLQRQHYINYNINPPLDIVWKKRIKSVIADHPLAFANVIFAPTVSGVLYTVDYFTGEGRGSGKLGPGLQNVPTIYKNEIYAGITLGNETLVGFNIRDGKKELSRSYPHITTTPAIADDKIFFGTDRNLFFCSNTYSGESIWQYQTKAGVQSSPAIQLSSVIFGDDRGWLYSLESSSGIEFWKIQLDGSVFSHPVLDDSVIYVGTNTGTMYAVKIKNGDIIWKKTFAGAIFSSPALFKNILYFGNNAHDVIAIHKKNGELVWKFKTNGIVNTVPLPTPSFLYITSWDRNLYVLDRYSGELIFKHPLDSPAKSSPIIYRDYLLIHTANRDLIAFANEKFVQEWRARR
jgi:outer membrane protein assembly factor BamB